MYPGDKPPLDVPLSSEEKNITPRKGGVSMSKRKSWIVGLATALPVIFLVGCGTSQIEPTNPLEAAQSGLAHFTNLVPDARSIDYGFENLSELRQATLGHPYQVYVLEGDFMRATDEWRYPVMVRGVQKALLTIAKRENRWQAVDFGAAILAKDLENHERALSYADNRVDNVKILLRNHAARCDFLMFKLPSQDLYSCDIHPLSSAKRYLEKTAGYGREHYNFDELLSLMPSSVEE